MKDRLRPSPGVPPRRSKDPRVKHQNKVKNYPILPKFDWKKFHQSSDESRVTPRPIKYRKRVWAMETVRSNGHTAPYALNTDVLLSASWSDTRTFVRNKDWRLNVAKGIDSSSPYTRTGGSIKPVTWFGRVDAPTTWSAVEGSGYVPATLTSLDNTSLKNTALGRLKHKLSNYIGNAQLAAPLAEAREIHRLVRQINEFGIDAVKAMLLARKTKGKSIAKLLANIWLGFGFGINPMLKDIESAANAISDFKIRNDTHTRVTGTASMDYRASVKGGHDMCTGMDVSIITDEYHVQSVRYVAGIQLNLRSAASYSVLDHCGLSISALPGAIWELIPYSWAVDYFTTIGPWLDDVFYTLPGVTKYVCLTEKHHVKATCIAKPLPNGNSIFTGGFGQGGHEAFSLVRTPLASLPTRSLRVKSFDEVGLYGMHKLLNLAAVLAQFAKAE